MGKFLTTLKLLFDMLPLIVIIIGGIASCLDGGRRLVRLLMLNVTVSRHYRILTRLI